MGLTSRRPSEVFGCPFLGIYICVYCPKKTEEEED
jgi:hypothetical protein